jgi:hypothetical protein
MRDISKGDKSLESKSMVAAALGEVPFLRLTNNDRYIDLQFESSAELDGCVSFLQKFKIVGADDVVEKYQFSSSSLLSPKACINSCINDNIETLLCGFKETINENGCIVSNADMQRAHI